MPNNVAPEAASPPTVLMQMMTGYWVSQAIYIAAKLGVADVLVDGPQSIEYLAKATQSDAPSLRRLLRALASVGAFTEVHPDTFALTSLAGLLRTGTPDSMRALALMYAEEQYRAWGSALHSIRTGGSVDPMTGAIEPAQAAEIVNHRSLTFAAAANSPATARTSGRYR